MVEELYVRVLTMDSNGMCCLLHQVDARDPVVLAKAARDWATETAKLLQDKEPQQQRLFIRLITLPTTDLEHRIGRAWWDIGDPRELLVAYVDKLKRS
jgi:hypothetical protein